VLQRGHYFGPSITGNSTTSTGRATPHFATIEPQRNSAPLLHAPGTPKLQTFDWEGRRVSREHTPVPGKWYENLEDEETFRVLSVDEDSELVEIEYLDGEIEELDLDVWHEMDLEITDEPEGWSDEADDDEEEDDDDWEDEEDEDEDDDWDDDEDEDEEDDDSDRY
jgi:segregation and condensation protein B